MDSSIRHSPSVLLKRSIRLVATLEMILRHWVDCSVSRLFQNWMHANLNIEPPVDDSHTCQSAVHCRVACLRSVETHLSTRWFVFNIPYILDLLIIILWLLSLKIQTYIVYIENKELNSKNNRVLWVFFFLRFSSNFYLCCFSKEISMANLMAYYTIANILNVKKQEFKIR